MDLDGDLDVFLPRCSSDAAPLAHEIIHFCVEKGYVGQASPPVVLPQNGL